MLAGQCEIGRVVIELTTFPAHFTMTVTARLTEAALVRIVFPMTTLADVGRFGMARSGFMAGVTGLRYMGALERKVAVIMIEQFRLQAHDVGAAAFVFGVTLFAGRLGHLRMPGMKALTGLEVPGNRLMTIQTQPVLRGAIEHVVTVAAIVLEIRMTLDHRARHHQ